MIPAELEPESGRFFLGANHPVVPKPIAEASPVKSFPYFTGPTVVI